MRDHSGIPVKAEVEDICDDVIGGDCGSIADFAAARVGLNKRMLTVQEVRLLFG